MAQEGLFQKQIRKRLRQVYLFNIFVGGLSNFLYSITTIAILYTIIALN